MYIVFAQTEQINWPDAKLDILEEEFISRK